MPVLAADGMAEDPKAGHDLVPVQVCPLQVAPLLAGAGVALTPVEQPPVVKGHDVA